MGQTVTIPAQYDQVAPVCDFIAEAAIAAGLDDDAAFQVQLACDEACTNIIEHAYAEAAGKIEVGHTTRSGYFIVTIRDYGRAFDPSAVPEPAIAGETPIDVDALEIGGLGLHFMRRLMDEVTFLFDHKNGNLLTMKKRLP